MEELTIETVGTWESEGGAPAQSEAGVPGLTMPPADAANAAKTALTGTANQIEWAEGIKERAGKEFERGFRMR
jgi:hypothetical protein